MTGFQVFAFNANLRPYVEYEEMRAGVRAKEAERVEAAAEDRAAAAAEGEEVDVEGRHTMSEQSGTAEAAAAGDGGNGPWRKFVNFISGK